MVAEAEMVAAIKKFAEAEGLLDTRPGGNDSILSHFASRAVLDGWNGIFEFPLTPWGTPLYDKVTEKITEEQFKVLAEFGHLVRVRLAQSSERVQEMTKYPQLFAPRGMNAINIERFYEGGFLLPYKTWKLTYSVITYTNGKSGCHEIKPLSFGEKWRTPTNARWAELRELWYGGRKQIMEWKGEAILEIASLDEAKVLPESEWFNIR